MVANNDQELRMHRLWTNIGDLVIRGKRDPIEVVEVLQRISDNRDFFEKLFPVEAQIRSWIKFHRKHFGIELNYKEVLAVIPAQINSFTRLIIIPKGLTLRMIVKKIEELMPFWMYTNNLELITSVRTSEKTYGIWIRDREEADKELKNLLADQLKEKGVNSITLEERLVLEIKFWEETGKHLDMESITLCAGSRHDAGLVLRVGWYDDKVNVHWCHADHYGGTLRVRQVVS